MTTPTTTETTEQRPRKRQLEAKDAAQADQLVTKARAGQAPTPAAPVGAAAPRGRGRPKGSKTRREGGEAAAPSPKEVRASLELEARAVWVPLCLMIEKLGGDDFQEEELELLVSSSVPMLEKYGGVPVEVAFLGAVAMVLGPRAVGVARKIRAKQRAAQELRDVADQAAREARKGPAPAVTAAA